MEMEPDAAETLRKLAGGGTIDYSAWPHLLATVVSHIEQTARNDFPIPRIPQPTIAATPPPPPEPRFLAPLPPSSDPTEPPSSSSEAKSPVNATNSGNESSGPSSQETNKENAAPVAASTSTSAAPHPLPTVDLEPGTLPPQITAMLAEITGLLNDSFHTYPPHTIQRLAELVLEPRKHYRSLPSYLHAVDRVVHVTSGNNIYPLPPAVPDMSHMHINGVTEPAGTHENSADHQPDQPMQAIWASNNSAPIGSDEALGGALLTPIPWLARRATNAGDGSSESGESSTLGSEAGGTALAMGPGVGANTSPSSSSSSSSPSTSTSSSQQQQQQQQQRQGRPFEMQVRTESTETIDGPNGMGSIETVSVSINGISSMSAAQQQRVITQGELIRQEQRAGVVPVSQLARSGPVVVTSTSSAPSTAAGEGADIAMGDGDGDGDSDGHKDTSSDKSDEEMADEEEAPHARGPDLIGAADMGPQKTGASSTFSISHGGNAEVRGIDVEAAVGRKHESQIPPAGGQGDGIGAADESDDAAVLTPASSDLESGTAAGSIQETVAGDRSKDAADLDKEAQAGKDQQGDEALPEDTKTEPKSATLSARSSPVKREADDDISEAESEAKRLRTSTLAEEAPRADVSDVSVATPPEAAAGTEPKEPEESKAEAEQSGAEGDNSAVPNASAEAAETGAKGDKTVEVEEEEGHRDNSLEP